MEGDTMKHFLMFCLIMIAALAFSFTIASPSENKNDIPIVFDVGPAVTNQLFDVAIERSPQESRRESFTFGNELSIENALSHNREYNLSKSETRRPPNLVLLA
jgi:hypothetical protein